MTRTTSEPDGVPSPEAAARAAALRIRGLLRTDIAKARTELDRLENQNPWFLTMVRKELEVMEKRGVVEGENEAPAKQAADTACEKPTCCGNACGTDPMSKLAEAVADKTAKPAQG